MRRCSRIQGPLVSRILAPLAALAVLSGTRLAAAQGSGHESDCPPGFPGCEEAPEQKSDTEAPEREKDAEALEAGSRTRATFTRDWLSVGVQVDALILPSARNVCAGGSGYTCFAGGTYYAALPLAGADDVVNGGIRLATTRVLIGYDRALDANVTLGGSLGYAFGGGPQRPGARAFEPVHVEGRASYWFGRDPLGRLGLRPFVTGALGIEEVDASIPADVYASASAYTAGQSQSLTAWRKTGLDFVALGLGALFAFRPNNGIFLELRGTAMFPTSGVGLSAQLGYSIGL